MLKHFGGGTGGETGLSRRKDEERSFDTSHLGAPTLARSAIARPLSCSTCEGVCTMHTYTNAHCSHTP